MSTGESNNEQEQQTKNRDDTTDYDAIRHQVQCDVDFLENRLKIMRAQYNPNQAVIRTYEEMLSSRLKVLSRLSDEHQINQQTG